MNNSNSVLLTLGWLIGIALAKGFWSTFFAIFIPLWGYYLIAEQIAIRFLS